MPTVKFLHDGMEAKAEQDEKLIDICKRENALVPFSCQDGNCGTCIIKVISGDLGKASEKEKNTLAIYGSTPEEGYRLACQCRVRSDVTIDEP